MQRDELASAFHGGRQELSVPPLERVGDLGFVAGGVGQGGPLDEQHEISVQTIGFRSNAEGTINARREGCQVHHH